jgi:hypothetical protein
MRIAATRGGPGTASAARNADAVRRELRGNAHAGAAESIDHARAERVAQRARMSALFVAVAELHAEPGIPDRIEVGVADG